MDTGETNVVINNSNIGGGGGFTLEADEEEKIVAIEEKQELTNETKEWENSEDEVLHDPHQLDTSAEN